MYHMKSCLHLQDITLATTVVSLRLASTAQDWSLLPMVCRRVEEAHAVIHRIQTNKRIALPHVISAELRFPENLEMLGSGPH